MRSARTAGLLIRREVGSSRRDGQPRHVKFEHAGGVAAGDPRIVVRGRLGLFVLRHALQDLRDSACAQRVHGFRHPVDHAQKGAGRTFRQELSLFPTAHCRDRYADPAREFGL